MKDTETFGVCLRKLMGILNLKGSVLAKGINVDSSLVYKWLRDERVPSYSSPHVDLIVDYFSKCIINSFQQENVINMLRKRGYTISEADSSSIPEAIRTSLLEGQGYSIEICADRKNEAKIKIRPNDYVQPKTFEMTNNMNNIPSSTPGPVPADRISWDSGKVKILEGSEEVMNSMLSLLKSVPKKNDNNDDSILITINNSVHPMDCSEEFNTQWKRILLSVLNKGWTVILLVRLSKDKRRIIKIIQDMQFALSSGRYCIYYYNKAETSPLNEIIIVPCRGALYCFSSKLKNQVDSAFLFESIKSIKLLSAHFSQFFTTARPLLHVYPSQMTIEYQKKFAEIEENLGDRYTFKGDISVITMPIDLYEKYLRISAKPEHEIALRLIYHRRRLEAFKTQIKYYKYKDIWFRESLEQLINEKNYPFDQYYILENNIPNSKDIAYHLENVIDMLEKYENYEIAIVSKKDYENLCKTIWMVKENNSVFIETFNPAIPRKSKSNTYESEINLHLSEKDVINAFQDYFMMIWNGIKYNDKDRNKIIKWLRDKINFLKSENCIETASS